MSVQVLNDNNSLISLQLERHCLGSLLKYPDLYVEIDAWISPSDFANKTHEIIYSIIRNSYGKTEKLDAVTLATKAKNLSVNTFEDISIFDYCDTLLSTTINMEGGKLAFKQLLTLRIRRDLAKTGGEIAQYVKKCGDVSVEEIISHCDKIYNDRVQVYARESEPVDMFEGIEEMIESRGGAPTENIGLTTPFPNFQSIVGGLRNGSLYAWTSRPGVGKSLMLNCLGYQVTVLNPGCKTLILDTENLTEDMKFRMAASLTSIPCWFLETGLYQKNQELYDKYQKAKNEDKFKISRKKIFHIQCAGKPITEIESIIKRWYLKEVGRGGQACIIYDYIKLTGESDYNKKEYELIGEKVNRLKELSVQLNVPILTACQLNRSAEGVSAVDSSSAVAQSDRLNWMASFLAIFRRKTLDELSDDGLMYGTHKMIILKSRFRGVESSQFHDYVKVPGAKGKSKFEQNFISFQVENFDVQEKGTLRDIVKSRREQYDIQKPVAGKEVEESF
jgi:replicative DNA helicase